MQIATIRAFAGDGPADLRDLWDGLLVGRFSIVASGATGEECFLEVVEGADHEAPQLRAHERQMLTQCLFGMSYKHVAIDSGCAISTVASVCAACLSRMGAPRTLRQAPHVLVVAAHVAGRLAPDWARIERLDARPSCWRVTTPRPDAQLVRLLPTAEFDVVRQLLIGHTHAEIASLRGTSLRTVANQIGSAFRRLRVSGRAELLSRLARGEFPGRRAGETRPRLYLTFSPLPPAARGERRP